MSASAPAFRSSADLLAPIARDLEAVERLLRQTLESPRPGVARLIDHLAHYRGKRLRPILLLLTAKACGGIRPAHHTLAAVAEMIHTATLVHDDVLDAATVRRHASTINAEWGNQASILLGDWLFTHAFHLTSTVDARACRLIGEATNRVCAGELHQVSERGNLELTEEAYLDIIDGKTAKLTSCCCRLGALYAGADHDVVESLAEYGRCLGLAFQIADDLLDLVGDERTAGKSLGTDLDQQKLTLPLIWHLRREPREHALSLRRLLETPGSHKRDRLRPELEESGAIAYARSRAEEFASRALTELTALPPSPCQALLEQLADRVVHRDR
jgi:octaprenyl-diphosphate synthase